MMKYGVYFAYWEHEWDVPYLPYVKKVKDLGFDFLEVGGVGIAEMSEGGIIELKDAAEENGIFLTAGIGLPQQYDTSSTDEAVRTRGIGYVKTVLDNLKSAGIGKLGGSMYTAWPVDYSRPFDKRKTWEQSVKSMGEIADHAAGLGIGLCIEPMNRFEHYLLNDAREAVAFVNDIGRDNVKITLDTFHMNIEEDCMTDAIRETGDALGHFHVGEANRKVPGKGHLPWREIGAALHGIGYEGTVVMEPFVMTGGGVGRDIKVWRDLSDNADTQKLDDDIRESLVFLRRAFDQS